LVSLARVLHRASSGFRGCMAATPNEQLGHMSG
jgi:hypothetical protein